MELEKAQLKMAVQQPQHYKLARILLPHPKKLTKAMLTTKLCAVFASELKESSNSLSVVDNQCMKNAGLTVKNNIRAS
jgi:hypothetical protein